MNRQTSSGGEGSNINQAGNDVTVDQSVRNYNYTVVSVDKQEVRSIAEEIIQDQMPALTAAAKAEWEHSSRDFITSVVEEVAGKDQRTLSSFREPRVQVALGGAQRGYAASPDDDLRKVLTDLVVGVAREDPRTHRDLLLRQCIDVASKLSSEQLNTLVLLVFIRHVVFWFAPGPRAALDFMRDLYKPYMLSIVSNREEFSYLASLGCGVEAQLTAEAFGGPRETPQSHLQKAHLHVMYDSFDLAGFEAQSGDELVSAGIVKVVPAYPFVQSQEDEARPLYRFSDDFTRRLLDAKGARMANPIENLLIEYMGDKWYPEGAFETLITEEYPELARLFNALDRTEAFSFRVNSIGRMLAATTAISRTPERKAEFETILLGPSERPRDQDATLPGG